MPADDRHAKQLFDRALERPPQERSAFLDGACAADHALRARVDAWLGALGEADEFLADPQPADSLDQAGTVIGRYKLLEEIGEGGMGTVWMAQQLEPVNRKVALKVIKLGMDTKQVVARFEAERQALAMMDHPNIANVLDGGTTPQGRPYFVMELIKGVPLTEYCDQAQLDTAQRLALIQTVCHAVQHAHQKGVIHRDLKPSNILVTLHDGQPVPKVIDFGVAKATASELTQKTLFTGFRQMIGTPLYTAPEQAELSSTGVDTRADVYSLGVLLYETLTGTPPFEARKLLDRGYAEMMRVIREDEPPKPSTRVHTLGDGLAAVAKLRHTTAQALGHRIRGDLDCIVMRAMAKDRTRRYDTANDLAADIARHLACEPVEARPPSVGYRLRKFARRNRVAVAAGGAIIITLIIGVVTTSLQYIRAEQKGEQFDQLAGIVRYETVAKVEAALYPPWPESIPNLERWLQLDCRDLLAMRAGIQSTVDGLRLATATESQVFLGNVLRGLLDRLHDLETRLKPAVEQRLSWARQVEGLTRAHPGARVSWDAARAAIAESDKYSGCAIELADRDVLGLVPIGENPRTGYWEFYHLRSAWDGASDPATITIPQHDSDDGSIEVTDAMGMVFVLLPGGEVTIGAQREDPEGDYYDPATMGPHVLQKVTLAPFFVARHELTKGQWARLWTWDKSRRDPSGYKAGQRAAGELMTLAHPVEQVSWQMSEELLRRYGLSLPTEAQWEYSCRAGTTTRWFCTLEELRLYANLADQTARSSSEGWRYETWSDGHTIYAAVGSFEANAFGLYDMHGNVWEHCLDLWGKIDAARRPGDGLLLQGNGSGQTMRRGGCYKGGRIAARSARRYHNPKTLANNLVGLRAARSLQPAEHSDER